MLLLALVSICCFCSFRLDSGMRPSETWVWWDCLRARELPLESWRCSKFETSEATSPPPLAPLLALRPPELLKVYYCPGWYYPALLVSFIILSYFLAAIWLLIVYIFWSVVCWVYALIMLACFNCPCSIELTAGWIAELVVLFKWLLLFTLVWVEGCYFCFLASSIWI